MIEPSVSSEPALSTEITVPDAGLPGLAEATAEGGRFAATVIETVADALSSPSLTMNSKLSVPL